MPVGMGEPPLNFVIEIGDGNLNLSRPTRRPTGDKGVGGRSVIALIAQSGLGRGSQRQTPLKRQGYRRPRRNLTAGRDSH